MLALVSAMGEKVKRERERQRGCVRAKVAILKWWGKQNASKGDNIWKWRSKSCGYLGKGISDLQAAKCKGPGQGCVRQVWVVTGSLCSRMRMGRQQSGRRDRRGSGNLSTQAFICCCESSGLVIDNTKLKGTWPQVAHWWRETDRETSWR